jgi:hypothetical protein
VCVDDAQRRLAIVELLDRPDPPELRRGHRLRVEGKPERFVMLTRLSAMYVQARLLAYEERRRAADENPMERDNTRWAGRRARKEALIAVPA